MYIPSAGYTIVVILVFEHLYSACRARRIAPAAVYDIAPTVLYLMGLSVARDMPGKVLTDALVSDYVERFPISYVETYGTKNEGECEEDIAFASSRDRGI